MHFYLFGKLSILSININRNNILLQRDLAGKSMSVNFLSIKVSHNVSVISKEVCVSGLQNKPLCRTGVTNQISSEYSKLINQCTCLFSTTVQEQYMIIWATVFKNGPGKVFKGCLPRNLLGTFLNTLPHMMIMMMMMMMMMIMMIIMCCVVE